MSQRNVFILLGALVVRFSRLVWGEGAGAPALAALSTSALAVWSLAMSQETGLTAVSLVAMLYFLERHHREPRSSDLVWAAIAAGVGAISRDYALAFAVFGAVVLLFRRDSFRHVLLFAGVTLCVAAPWYGRTWLLTGNPVYPHTLDGLLPGNPVHDETMRYISDAAGFGSTLFQPGPLFASLVVLTGAVTLAGLIGVGLNGRRCRALVGGIGLATGLWLASFPFTAGGAIYSTRVLLPALALFAVLSGWIATAKPRTRLTLALLVSVLALDAARRSWLLPDFALAGVKDYSFARSRQTSEALRGFGASPLWPLLAAQAGDRRTVVDHPANHAFLTMARGKAVPFFSPALAPAFDDMLDFDTALARLKANHIRFVTLSDHNSITLRFVAAHPFWSTLRHGYAPSFFTSQIAVYDLDQLRPFQRQPDSPEESR